MKGILSGRSVKYELNHDLVKLAKLVNVGGAPYADVDLARKISTPASVSYDKPVSKQEALEAHTNLLCFLAAMQAPPHES